MIKKFYYFKVTNRDYFDHFRKNFDPEDGIKIKKFNNLKEVIVAWKESRQNDFYWPDDHERETSRIKIKWEYIPEEKVKHGLVLGYKPKTEEEEFMEFLREIEEGWSEPSFEIKEDYLPW